MNCFCAHGFTLCSTSVLLTLSFSLFSFSVHLLFIIVIETLAMIKKEINDPIAVIIVICSILNLVLSMILDDARNAKHPDRNEIWLRLR